VTCAPEGGADVSVHVTAVESAFGGLYPEDAGLRPPARAKRASDANVTLEPVAAGEAGDALDCVELMKPQAALVIGKHTQLKSLSTRKPISVRSTVCVARYFGKQRKPTGNTNGNATTARNRPKRTVRDTADCEWMTMSLAALCRF
jgi:hypothetical protein